MAGLDYLRELRSAPAPLTRLQKQLVMALFIVIAVSRLIALSKTLVDWDEALFCGGVNDYNVAVDHPHAPGYPLFVLAGKAARLIADSDFHALQIVVTLAAMLLFPAAFYFARELRLPFGAALASATLLPFLPTVWYFGGTALSDVPALCVSLFAAATLLRGGRNARAYLVGMLLLGVSGAIRSPSVMMLAVPAVVAFGALRSFRTLLAGGVIAGTVIVGSYTGAALASDNFPHGFLERVQHNRQHVRDNDSYRNPSRPSLRDLAPLILGLPFRGGKTGMLLTTLAVAGVLVAIVRRRGALLVILAMFVPVALVTWIMLDITSATRYAVAYLPMYPLLAAIAIGEIASWFRRYRDAALAFATFAFVVMFTRWTYPTLRMVATTDSPVYAALQWVHDSLRPGGPKIYIDNEFFLHASYLLRDRDYQVIWETDDLPESEFRPGNVYLLEGGASQPGARVFTRADPKRIRELARPRYGAVSAVPMEKMLRFGKGWYQAESDGSHSWRWMNSTSVTRMESFGSEPGELRLGFHVPLDTMKRPPLLTITWNGAVIEQRQLKATDVDIDLRYVLPSRSDLPNELHVEVDQSVNPMRLGISTDNRDFGLMLTAFSWKHVAGQPQIRK